MLDSFAQVRLHGLAELYCCIQSRALIWGDISDQE